MAVGQKYRVPKKPRFGKRKIDPTATCGPRLGWGFLFDPKPYWPFGALLCWKPRSWSLGCPCSSAGAWTPSASWNALALSRRGHCGLAVETLESSCWRVGSWWFLRLSKVCFGVSAICLERFVRVLGFQEMFLRFKAMLRGLLWWFASC